VITKYEDLKRKDSSLTEDQISKKIAAFFNHNAEISKKYLRKTLDSLDDSLTSKEGFRCRGGGDFSGSPGSSLPNRRG
jgi:hypothetical protein